MLVQAKHPGWPRLLAAVLLGPLATPVVTIVLFDSNNARAVESLINYFIHFLQDPLSDNPILGVSYPATIVFGLPVVLVLCRFEMAGFIPVMIAGTLFGAASGALFSIFGAGMEMFITSLFVTAACWLIAFAGNRRAQPQPPMGQRANAVPRRPQATR